MGFVAFLGPQLIASLVVVPVILIALQVPIEDSLWIQTLAALASFVVAFWLLVLIRKRLYKLPRTERAKDAVIVHSLEIIELEDGTFSVNNRVFQTRKDAEEFVDFTRSIQH